MSRGACRKNRAVSVVVSLLAVGAMFLVPRGPTAQAEQEVPIPGMGSTCAACHPEPASEWARTLHRRTVGAPQIPEDRQGCAACHTGASLHLEDPMVEENRPSLAKMSGNQIADMCLSCHRGQQMLWNLSPHQTTEKACLTCHDPHGGVGTAMLKAPEPQLCQECHPTQVAEGSLPFHHPIAEGKMVCTDCHNVHGEQRGALPAASNGEMCFKCHAEKGGPFVYEHPPVTEDCTICHKPHGSQNDNLLVQEQPMLCLQCHAGHSDGHRSPLIGLDPSTPEGAANAEIGLHFFYDKCTSCHGLIHGTDLPSGTNNGTLMPGGPLPTSDSGSAALFAAASMDQSLWGFSGIDFDRFDEDGTPNFVREYDGKNYDVPSPEIVVSRFGAADDFRLEMKDFARGDQDVNLRFGNSLYDVQFSESALTHRLHRFNDPAEGAGNVPIAGNSVEVTDLSGGKDDYHRDRTTFDLKLAARHPKLSNVKWMANAWQEAETGSQQFLFLERCVSCHHIQVSQPIDRKTTITEVGFQLDLKSAALRYMRENRDFSSRAPEEFYNFPGRFSVFSGDAPLFGVANTDSNINDFRAAGQVGKQVTASGLWRTDERDNRLGGGQLDVRSAGGGLGWTVSRDLRVGVSFIGRSLDVTGVDEGISRDRDSTRIDARYTGLPGSTVSVGYAKEKVDRTERAYVPLESDSNIWRASLISRITPKTRLQLQYRNTKTDVSNDFFDPDAPPTFFPSRLIGLPNDGTSFSGVLSHSLTPNTLLSALYSRRDDNYDVSVAELAISHSAEQETRTTGLQLVHTPGRRARVSASYYRQKGDNQTDATYGQGDYVLTPPTVPADLTFSPIESMTAFDYDATIGLIDASYWATSKVRLFGRYSSTKTDGRETAYDMGDYLDQNPDLEGTAVEFHPFDIDIVDDWVGIGYLINPTTEVALSHQRRSWDNSAEATQDGSYTVWRLGVRSQF